MGNPFPIRNLIFIFLFLTLTPIALATSAYSLVVISTSAKKEPEPQVLATHNFLENPKAGVNIYASLPETLPSITLAPEEKDSRPEIIRQYLALYKSPLTPYADLIVQKADEYKLDFRLTTAIAQQESNLCKKIPENTFNCWGWGIHSQGTLGFDSFEHAIDIVTLGLKQKYIDDGLATPDDIMKRYTPLSKGSWAEGVNQFMSEMQ